MKTSLSCGEKEEEGEIGKRKENRGEDRRRGLTGINGYQEPVLAGQLMLPPERKKATS
jgi:hypothetical protein